MEHYIMKQDIIYQQYLVEKIKKTSMYQNGLRAKNTLKNNLQKMAVK